MIQSVFVLLATLTNLCAAPLHIEAKKQIVCNQVQGVCQAEGHTSARQGTFKILADSMKMTFLHTPKTVQKLWADGNVCMLSSGIKAQGDQAFYCAQKQIVSLSGHAQMNLQDVRITSQEPFIFNRRNNKGFVKNPHVVFSAHEATLVCDRLTVTLLPAKKEGHVPFYVRGTQGVLFATPYATIAADQAVYSTPQGTISLQGQVRIIDRRNIALMDRAIYHLETQKFLFYSPTNKRVRGVVRVGEMPREILPTD